MSIKQNIPETIDGFMSRVIDFSNTLRELKGPEQNEWGQWFPYNSIASLKHLEPVLRENWQRFRSALESGPIIDIGCGDGDVAFFFAALGCNVCAVDYAPTNFNFMGGVRELRKRTGLDVDIREANLDLRFSIEEDDWGLAVVLGILYHLKNPFQVLEQLAWRARYCLLSTRIARMTTSGVDIQHEPVAYLLDSREANNDPSNYWIFSEKGLLRLVRRSGWRMVGALSLGSERSNPVDGEADERMYLLLRSQFRSVPATIRLLDGWTDVQFQHFQHWRWTMKRFSFEVRLAEEQRPHGFALGFVLPAAITDAGEMILRCSVNGIPCTQRKYTKPGEHLYEAELPATVKHRDPILMEFEAVHGATFSPDPRELGVIMSCNGEIRGISEKIVFWLD